MWIVYILLAMSIILFIVIFAIERISNDDFKTRNELFMNIGKVLLIVLVCITFYIFINNSVINF